MEEKALRDIITFAESMDKLDSTIEAIAKGMQRYSGFEGIGVRIKNTFGDYPYFTYLGFKDSFVATENSLCSRDKDGNLEKDQEGNYILECMCGNILQGRFDPKQPFFTEGGSFWVNSTTELLQTTSEKERQSRTRNKCNKAGYESVGLFPLKHGEIVLGLLQMNSRKKNMFSEERAQMFEAFAKEVGRIVFYAMMVK